MDNVTLITAGHNFKIGDKITVSGSLNSELGRSWPRPVLQLLRMSSPKMRTFIEAMMRGLQTVVRVMSGYKFGPQRFTVLSVANTSVTVSRG